MIFLIAATAETNHPPFDLVEAEQELVGGFNTEYTGIRFAIFYLAEFMNVITMSAIAVTLFLGGPSGPSLGFLSDRRHRQRVAHADLLVPRSRCSCCCSRPSGCARRCPRMRYDRLMSLGWKWLIEIAILWVLVTATLQVAYGSRTGTGSSPRWSRSPSRSLAYGVLFAAMPKSGEKVEEFR